MNGSAVLSTEDLERILAMDAGAPPPSPGCVDRVRLAVHRARPSVQAA